MYLLRFSDYFKQNRGLANCCLKNEARVPIGCCHEILTKNLQARRNDTEEIHVKHTEKLRTGTRFLYYDNEQARSALSFCKALADYLLASLFS